MNDEHCKHDFGNKPVEILSGLEVWKCKKCDEEDIR